MFRWLLARVGRLLSGRGNVGASVLPFRDPAAPPPAARPR